MAPWSAASQRTSAEEFDHDEVLTGTDRVVAGLQGTGTAAGFICRFIAPRPRQRGSRDGRPSTLDETPAPHGRGASTGWVTIAPSSRGAGCRGRLAPLLRQGDSNPPSKEAEAVVPVFFGSLSSERRLA